MQPIILTQPISSDTPLERLNLFPGRHLGENEFEHMQAYTDRRLAPLLHARDPGVLQGLEIRTGMIGLPDEGFILNPGLALSGSGQLLGLFYPLRQSWKTLIEEFIEDSGSSDASGIFYLTLQRNTRYIDADPETRPCQRMEFDPLRDARRVLAGSVGLFRLGVPLTNTATREQIENWVAANNVERELLTSMDSAVPVGLLAIDNIGTDTTPDYQVSWFSREAGYYPATPNGGYEVLLAQVKAAFQRKILEAHTQQSEASLPLLDYLHMHLKMHFLPAAGELPKELIRNIASPSPSLGWLPRHVYVDMVAVPEESVNELITRHLPRRAIDLQQPGGERMRLLVAVNEPDFKPDLMHFPKTDQQLHVDIYRYSQRAYKQWQHWMKIYNDLYYVHEDNMLSDAEVKTLDLPDPVEHPLLPQVFFQKIIAQGKNELGTSQSDTPYPYNEGIPAVPDFYQQWGRLGSLQNIGQTYLPPELATPAQNGLVLRLTIAQHRLEELDNEIRAMRARLEKTRDYLLLQRQQLDNQTVSLAALAGGVAGDGSGLQVARWLPFTQLKTPDEPEVETSTEASGGAGGGTATGEAIISANSAGAVPVNYSTKDFVYESMNIPASFSLSSGKVRSTDYAKMSISGTKINLGSFSNTLRKRPKVLSNVQLSLNSALLDKIAEAPRTALTRPAFEAKEFRFGVLAHIRPEIQEYKKLVRSMAELLATLQNLFDKAETGAIRKVLDSFGKPTPLSDLGLEGSDESATDQLTSKIYEAMFKAGKILVKQIAYIEGRYSMIEAKLEGRLRARINQEASIEKLAALIRKATEELDSVDKRRIEYLGDYGVAQRLLDDDWKTIYNENLERTRILTTAVKGLYYVRERQTPISMPLADPLELRYGSATDIVPGCDWETNPNLPEELEDFFDTVMEVPMADWTTLGKLTNYIPAKQRLEFIGNVRKARFAAKQTRSKSRVFRRNALNLSLTNVHQQSFSMLQHMSRYYLPFSIASLRQQQREAAKVLSLEDILGGTRGYLRREAQTLSTRLEQGIHCLLEKLDEIAPSLRLQWAQLAEDDNLYIENVERWPGLERAEREDFNATRTVSELIAWWFRQIDQTASANGRTAMRNMIRATLIHSALGDPTEILQGKVHVPPRLLARGETLRLHLNRPARPGTVLQLLDTSQRIVAVVNIEDDDEKSAIARVTKVADTAAVVTTQFRVVANKLTRFL